MGSRNEKEPAQVASDTGSFVSNVAGAVNPARPALGRLSDTAAAVTLGPRLLSSAWRLFKRHPLSVSVAGVALVWAAYSLRAGSSTRARARHIG